MPHDEQKEPTNWGFTNGGGGGGAWYIFISVMILELVYKGADIREDMEMQEVMRHLIDCSSANHIEPDY